MVGDIVITPFPFTDLSQSKIRPAVVLADVGMTDWILCEITTSTRVRIREIGISTGDMQTGSLRVGSRARTDQIATLNESLFLRTIGQLNEPKLDEILAAVRGLF